MTDDSLGAQGELDEESRYGDTRVNRAVRKVLDRVMALETDRDAAKAAIQDLRQRVAALERKVP